MQLHLLYTNSGRPPPPVPLRMSTHDAAVDVSVEAGPERRRNVRGGEPPRGIQGAGGSSDRTLSRRTTLTDVFDNPELV